MTLEKGTRVVGTDDEEIGTVTEVIADRQKDIFSGIAVKSGLFSNQRFVPAEHVQEITNEVVRVGLPAAEAENRLDPYP